MNYRIIRYTLGMTLYIETFCLIIPLLCAFFCGELNYVPYFLFTMALTKTNIGKLNATISIDQLTLSESR